MKWIFKKIECEQRKSYNLLVSVISEIENETKFQTQWVTQVNSLIVVFIFVSSNKATFVFIMLFISHPGLRTIVRFGLSDGLKLLTLEGLKSRRDHKTSHCINYVNIFSATKNYFWRGQSKTRVQPFGKTVYTIDLTLLLYWYIT